MQLQTIGQIAITVKDVVGTANFYRDVLKMKHLFSLPNMAFFDCDGIRLMLTLPLGHGVACQNSVLYFKVDNIQAAYQDMLQKNVHFEA